MAIADGTCDSFCNQPKAHFGLPWVHPWDNRGKFTWMKRGFIACQMHSSIYPCILFFNRLRAIARYWSEIATFFLPPLHLTPPLGCSHWNSGKKFGPQKTRIMGLPSSEDSLTIGWAVLSQNSSTYHKTCLHCLVVQSNHLHLFDHFYLVFSLICSQPIGPLFFQ